MKYVANRKMAVPSFIEQTKSAALTKLCLCLCLCLPSYSDGESNLWNFLKKIKIKALLFINSKKQFTYDPVFLELNVFLWTIALVWTVHCHWPHTIKPVKFCWWHEKFCANCKKVNIDHRITTRSLNNWQ